MVREKIDASKLDLQEVVVKVKRVAKVVKGGKRFHFTALVVVGDKDGHVGYALGKAGEVAEAIKKASFKAKKNLIKVPRRGTTIPHEYVSRLDAAIVLLKPASPGTGVIAGGGIRVVLELAGIKDILTKSLGSSNTYNTVRATFKALKEIKTLSDFMRLRGKSWKEIIQ